MPPHQRFRTSEGQAQLMDELDVVTFRYGMEGDVRISKRASEIDPGVTSVISVYGDDNITRLGEWMSELPIVGTGMDGDAANLSTKNEESVRLAAVSVLSPHDAETTQIIDTADMVLGIAETVLGHANPRQPRTDLDERFFNAGLLHPTMRSALLAKHRAEELTLFTARGYYGIPVPTINRLGRWLLEGKQTLVKSSIWSTKK
ncbi:MAG TPA: hypothetical protein VIH90_04130 [Candidatus Saccharimonadales bacterium]